MYQKQFIKNQHTQYYKRWVRKYEPFVGEDGTINMPSANQLNKQKSDYNEQMSQRNSTRSFGDGNWEELGPWEYDHDAAIQLSQSPGGTHVYTVEQSKSNPKYYLCRNGKRRRLEINRQRIELEFDHPRFIDN